MAESTSVNKDTKLLELGGKYLTFTLNEEEYGIEILKVTGIIGMMDITPVPRTPEFVVGVINLRGKVIPITDLRIKFDMPTQEITKLSCIIVVAVENLEMGVLVDSVSEVMDINGANIEDAPSFGTEVDTEFILGMGKKEDKVMILLNIAKVLTGDEISELEAIAE